MFNLYSSNIYCSQKITQHTAIIVKKAGNKTEYTLSDNSVGLQIYKMINLGSNVIVYKLKHCVLHFEVNMMTF